MTHNVILLADSPRNFECSERGPHWHVVPCGTRSMTMFRTGATCANVTSCTLPSVTTQLVASEPQLVGARVEMRHGSGDVYLMKIPDPKPAMLSMAVGVAPRHVVPHPGSGLVKPP